MDLKNKNILIFGLGKSGLAVLKFLLKKAAHIFIYDSDKLKLKRYKKNNICVLQNEDIAIIDLVVLSPGVNKKDELLQKLKVQHVQIISELEFGFMFLKTKNVVAITGTNGKTTTTELISGLLSTTYKTYKCGNIGVPLTACIEKINKDDYAVVEVSSFMLEDIKSFKPSIAIITNLASDHLDRYKSINEYQQTKLKITQNQNKNDYLILNDNLLNNNIETLAKTYYFSRDNEVVGVFCKNDEIYYQQGIVQPSELIMPLNEIQIRGSHNLENVLASICCTKLCGVSNELIRQYIKDFHSIEHRFEIITTINGVQFVNDSKATNIHATLNAVKDIKTEVHLLLGGSDKGEDFNELFRNLPNNVRTYLFGSTTNKMVYSCVDVGFKNFKICKNMQEALQEAYKRAKKNEIVLLSPACASFDSFANFEERGKQFKEYVFALYENDE